MSGGFEHDPEAIRGFAEVFTMASEQVTHVQGAVANTSAKADSFGNSWHEQGGKFERYMADLSADLANLSTYLNAVGTHLTQTSMLSVQADSGDAFANITDVEPSVGTEEAK